MKLTGRTLWFPSNIQEESRTVLSPQELCLPPGLVFLSMHLAIMFRMISILLCMCIPYALLFIVGPPFRLASSSDYDENGFISTMLITVNASRELEIAQLSAVVTTQCTTNPRLPILVTYIALGHPKQILVHDFGGKTRPPHELALLMLKSDLTSIPSGGCAYSKRQDRRIRKGGEMIYSAGTTGIAERLR